MTLTELSYHVRRISPFLLIFFLVFLIIFYSIQIFMTLQKGEQKQSLYVDPVFGKIKQINIENALKPQGLNFTLDNVEGKPITSTEAAKVYFIPPKTTRFGYREKIYLIAKTLGFDTDAIKHRITNNEAVFNDGKQRLSIDIANFNFTYNYFFETDPAILEEAVRPSRDEAEDAALNFLRSIDKYPDEFTVGSTNIVFSYFDKEKKTVKVLRDNIGANLVEVDLYRPSIDGISLISSRYPNSHDYVLLAAVGEGYRILKAQIRYFEKSEEQVGFYPLKTGEQAFNSLKKGEGQIMQFPKNKKEIAIKKMFLGYFDPFSYQEFLQPVYVFLGDDFLGFIPAISDQFLSE